MKKLMALKIIQVTLGHRKDAIASPIYLTFNVSSAGNTTIILVCLRFVRLSETSYILNPFGRK